MNKGTLNTELKRVQDLLAQNNNGLSAIVCPRFLDITNPDPNTNVVELNCTHSTVENISAYDWMKIVDQATEINKKNGGKATQNDAGDIMSGRLIAVRNGQGLAVAVLQQNISRDELYTMSQHKTGYTLSFVLPTHSKKLTRNKVQKPRVEKKLPEVVA